MTQLWSCDVSPLAKLANTAEGGIQFYLDNPLPTMYNIKER
jgi:hypothetical protein